MCPTADALAAAAVERLIDDLISTPEYHVAIDAALTGGESTVIVRVWSDPASSRVILDVVDVTVTRFPTDADPSTAPTTPS
jgi:hypothetical protein